MTSKKIKITTSHKIFILSYKQGYFMLNITFIIALLFFEIIIIDFWEWFSLKCFSILKESQITYRSTATHLLPMPKTNSYTNQNKNNHPPHPACPCPFILFNTVPPFSVKGQTDMHNKKKGKPITTLARIYDKLHFPLP